MNGPLEGSTGTLKTKPEPPARSGSTLKKQDATSWLKKAREALVAERVEEAGRFLRQGAESGDLDCMCELGRALRDGHWGLKKKSADEAGVWMEKAAQGGHAGAMAEYGFMLIWGGNGVSRDEPAGHLWGEKALEADDKKRELWTQLQQKKKDSSDVVWSAEDESLLASCSDYGYASGFCLRHGVGCGREEQAAARMWQWCASQAGNNGSEISSSSSFLWSQFQWGMCLYYGTGIAQDRVEALSWLIGAANQGHAEAQYHVGYCRYFGWGQRDNDYGDAVRWWKKAAQQGDRASQYRLGKCFRDGDGVEEGKADLKKAKEWWEKSAAQGYVDAIEELEKMMKQQQPPPEPTSPTPIPPPRTTLRN